MKRLICIVAGAACVLVACGGGSSGSLPAWLGAPAVAQASTVPAVQLTPVGMRVENAPVPVKGSDGLVHVTYELELNNFTASSAVRNGLDVIDAATGNAVASLQPADIANRLVVRDKAAVAGTLGASQLGLLYLHLSFADQASVPAANATRYKICGGPASTWPSCWLQHD